MSEALISATKYQTLESLQFLISAWKWNFILFALLYLKKMGEKLRLLPGEFRHPPKAELVTLRLISAYVALGLDELLRRKALLLFPFLSYRIVS